MYRTITFNLGHQDYPSLYTIAKEYESFKQYASAISFYLEAADATSREEEQYNALVRAAKCYIIQGGRNLTAKDLLKHASTILIAPDAYFLLSKIYEERKDWLNCYLYADIALSYIPHGAMTLDDCNSDSVLFQKAVGAWWIGKNEESRELMYKLYTNSTEFRTLAFNNLRSIGYPRSVFQYNYKVHKTTHFSIFSS